MCNLLGIPRHSIFYDIVLKRNQSLSILQVCIESAHRIKCGPLESRTYGLVLQKPQKICEKVSRKTAFVEAHSQPPTSAASKYHSRRVFYQVQLWREEDEGLDPKKLGWKQIGGKLLPIKTDLSPGTEELLKIIHCACKKDCNTNRCSCRRHGLSCSPACIGCNGATCLNCTLQDDIGECSDTLSKVDLQLCFSTKWTPKFFTMKLYSSTSCISQ